jgi:phage terminase large subunit-like protein
VQKKRKATSSETTEQDQSNYVAVAIAYAKDAVSDRKRERYGKWIRLAAKRFLADLVTAKKKDSCFTFDAWHAIDACDFIEKLPHVEGVWPKGATIVLEPAQVFFIVNLFGFRDRNGNRRFSTALFAVARKNAKSTLASAVLLYCYCCEPEVGPQIITGATTGSQARIVFNVAKRMVEKLPDLREAFTLEPFANAVARFDVGGTFKPINAKASTQDGLNPSAVCLDEIHAHQTSDLLDVLKSAAGARANPLFLYTTTEGYENAGPWSEIRHFAKQVLSEAVQADHFLAIYYAIDDEDDEFDSTKWQKANPLIHVNKILEAEIAKEAIEAKSMPGRMAEFRIKRLNRQSASAQGWIDLHKWKECGGEIPFELLETVPCYAGLDLASTTDFVSFRKVWHLDGIIYTHGRRWVPAKAVAQRTNRGTVPYAKWVESGLLEQTEGNVVDNRVIEAAIREEFEKFNIVGIAFDRWNATEMVGRLLEDEIPMIEFVQGPKSYHPAMKELERLYMSSALRHGGDELLQWCASNIVARKDVNLNMAPDKRKSAEKIDDMCALLMALGISMNEQESGVITQGFVRL